MIQLRDARAFKYVPNHRREELVVDLMIDALRDAPNRSGRQAALVHFIERVAAEDADTLRRAFGLAVRRHGIRAFVPNTLRRDGCHRPN